jgi:VanZ family protein
VLGEIILGNSPVTYHPWQGEIHGLAIYSKEVTAEQALAHYQSWAIRDGYPADLDAAMARYTFTEASGREIHDDVAKGPTLEIPTNFSVPHKGLLRSPLQEFRPNWHYAMDLAINIAGFIPLGLVLCACLVWSRDKPKAVLIATVQCAMLSLAIEILQFYIPRRGSGITDIITNSLGAFLGAMLIETVWVQRTLEHMKLVPALQPKPIELRAAQTTFRRSQ